MLTVVSVPLQCHMVRDVSDLNSYIAEDQTPSACGGRTSHDQLEWVEFFKVRWTLFSTIVAFTSSLLVNYISNR